MANAFELVKMHIYADETCDGFGFPLDREAAAAELALSQEALQRLMREQTLATGVPANRLRVLPKLRTPQAGINLRSISQHLDAVVSEVDVRWEVPQLLASSALDEFNLLLCPWPLEVDAEWFSESPDALGIAMDVGHFSAFDYRPKAPFPKAELERVLRSACRGESGRVHAVVFPECALAAEDLPAVQAVLTAEGVRLLIAGVHGSRRNYAYIGFNRSTGAVDNPTPTPSATSALAWQDDEQDKHHRWSLDSSQIRTYGLQRQLPPNGRRYWEAIDIRRRALKFFTITRWLTLCPLICEDLARQEPVTPVLRSIGPTLVLALLLDGPQLVSRWPSKYAGVLAEDPESCVLSLTSLGMVRRTMSGGHPENRVVALWSAPAPHTERREISLPHGSTAVLLQLRRRMATCWTADGRNDLGRTAQLELAAVDFY